MNKKNDFALVPRPPSSVEKTQPGARRILSGIVADTLALTNREQLKPAGARFRIGEYEWREPDYRQILIWAKALTLEPQEMIRRLVSSRNNIHFNGYYDYETKFVGGRILKLCWDFDLLPLEKFEWVDGLAVTHLGFASPPKTEPELSLHLPMLTHLLCSELGLTKLDLTELPLLTELRCGCNKLTELKLSCVPMLTFLTCLENQLTDLDLTGQPLLKELNCRNNQLTELDLSGVPLLTDICCHANQLTDIDLTRLPWLTSLHCAGNQLTELDLSGLPLLRTLCCDENQLREIDLVGVPMLKSIECGENQLTQLDLSGMPELWSVQCEGNQLVKLTLTGLPLLTDIWCENNRLTELDIRPFFKLMMVFYDADSTHLVQRPDQHF